MPVLVGRGQLVVKEVNGAKLTGKDLAQYFEVRSSTVLYWLVAADKLTSNTRIQD